MNKKTDPCGIRGRWEAIPSQFLDLFEMTESERFSYNKKPCVSIYTEFMLSDLIPVIGLDQDEIVNVALAKYWLASAS